MPDYNKLAKEIHQEQVDKGWYDSLRSDRLLILLVKSETNEAFEAWRKDRYTKCNSTQLKVLIGDLNKHGSLKSVQDIFKESVKDTVEDELADAAIRLLDFAAYKGITLEPTDRKLVITQEEFDYLYLHDWLDSELTQLKTTAFLKEVKTWYKNSIQLCIRMIEHFCEEKEIDLYLHIEAKRAYNRTRSARHGNKKA
jgi:NTP pyrophosphatase (non-canonical NTP hydrolase)